MFLCPDAGNESGSRILDTLQWINIGTEEVLPEWSCSNPFRLSKKSIYQTRRDIGTENSPDGFKAAKLEDTDTNDGADMVSHG